MVNTGEENLNVSNQKASRQVLRVEYRERTNCDEDDGDREGNDDHNKLYTHKHTPHSHTHSINVNDLYISMI